MSKPAHEVVVRVIGNEMSLTHPEDLDFAMLMLSQAMTALGQKKIQKREQTVQAVGALPPTLNGASRA